MKICCPNCGREGVLPQGIPTPALVRCPQCDHKFRPGAEPGDPGEVPPGDLTPVAPREFLFCRQCGTRNAENNYQCTNCGYLLHEHEPAYPRPIAPAGGDPGMGGLIPYKNSHALVAYYLGVFSLIPCVGLVLGVLAVVFGVMGLNFANRHPEAKGKAHAWVGVILGGGCALANLALFLVPFILAASRSH